MQKPHSATLTMPERVANGADGPTRSCLRSFEPSQVFVFGLWRSPRLARFGEAIDNLGRAVRERARCGCSLHVFAVGCQTNAGIASMDGLEGRPLIGR
jgi:hypothetical protein